MSPPITLTRSLFLPEISPYTFWPRGASSHIPDKDNYPHQLHQYIRLFRAESLLTDLCTRCTFLRRVLDSAWSFFSRQGQPLKPIAHSLPTKLKRLPNFRNRVIWILSYVRSQLFRVNFMRKMNSFLRT